jgi:UDP-glucose 4-epimerase
MSQEKILVIGGAGYIGSATVKLLCEQCYSVTVFDNLSAGDKNKVDSRAKLVVGDMLNRNDLTKVFGEEKFSSVIHFAALKAVGESEEKPAEYFRNNVAGTINVLEAMSKHQVPQMVFSSSASVYAPAGEEHNGVFRETDPLGPISVYGQTKYISELIIQDFARTGKIQSYALLRYFNVAGDAGLNFKEKNPQNVFPLIAKAVTGEASFAIFGDDYPTKDGTGVRDYIHLIDLVEAHIKALQVNEKNSGAFNLGTSNGFSVQELVDAFEKISGKPVGAKVEARRPGDPAVVLADPTKAEKELGWKAQHTLEEMVSSTLRVYGE